MPRPENVRCETCCYFQTNREEPGTYTYGECRIGRPRLGKKLGHHGRCPTVGPKFWCGEWSDEWPTK